MDKYYKQKSWKLKAQRDLPYLPTPIEVIKEIFNALKRLGILSNIHSLLDLGAGDGRILIHAAQNYQIEGIGLEINTELLETGRQKIRNLQLTHLCHMCEEDLYNYSLGNPDVIYYYNIGSNQRFFRHVFVQIQKGTYLVSVKSPLDYFLEELVMLEEMHSTKYYSSYIYQKK
jgi:16S rRNA G966 N2-methylase RsmD